MLTLRFTLDVTFDSPETANAYGVAVGFALSNIRQNALDISESPAPRIEREQVAVAEIPRAGGNA